VQAGPRLCNCARNEHMFDEFPIRLHSSPFVQIGAPDVKKFTWCFVSAYKRVVMLNEVKHLGREVEVGTAPEGTCDAQILSRVLQNGD